MDNFSLPTFTEAKKLSFELKCGISHWGRTSKSAIYGFRKLFLSVIFVHTFHARKGVWNIVLLNMEKKSPDVKFPFKRQKLSTTSWPSYSCPFAQEPHFFLKHFLEVGPEISSCSGENAAYWGFKVFKGCFEVFKAVFVLKRKDLHIRIDPHIIEHIVKDVCLWALPVFTSMRIGQSFWECMSRASPVNQ